MSVNLFGINFGVIFIIVILVLIVLLSAVLVYQVRLIRRISFLKANSIKPKIKEEDKLQSKNPVLAAVIIAAINQYKNQNLQR